LKSFQLTKQEWELLEKLFPLLEACTVLKLLIPRRQFSDMYLQVFLIATHQILQSKTLLVHEVIPILTSLREHLTNM